jgi:hypothetical protein
MIAIRRGCCVRTFATRDDDTEGAMRQPNAFLVAFLLSCQCQAKAG